MISRRVSARLSPLGFAVLVACSSGDRLLIEITHPGGRDPALWEGELSAVLVHDGDSATVAEGAVRTKELGSPAPLFEDLSLEEGETYSIILRAELTGRNSCDRPQAVGVSPPFVYGPELEVISVYVDCADQVSSAGQLHAARLYHTATFLPLPRPHGRVVITGGGSLENLADAADLSKIEVHDSIESFDVASSAFSLSEARLSEARAFHQATAVGPDRLLVTGGLLTTMNAASTTLPVPLDSVDLLSDDRVEVLPDLIRPRGMHAAVLVAEDRLLLAGGLQNLLWPGPTAELYDPQEGLSVGGLLNMKSAHVWPAAVSLGGPALIIGGAWLANTALKEDIFCPEGGCTSCDGPCFAPLGGFPKGEGRTNLAAVHVPCGPDQPGAVYVLGGGHKESENPPVPAQVFDDIYCVDAGSIGQGLHRAGRLRRPRQGHTATEVRGPEKKQRLFVAGGFDDAGQIIREAELVPVSCECPAAEISPEQISEVPLINERFGHTATKLTDGTVLLTGGIIGSNTAERFTPAL